jgi:hypothetical protein
MPKSPPDIGFDLEELAEQVNHYKGPAKPMNAQTTAQPTPSEPAAPAASTTLGRPRLLASSSSFSVRITDEQRQWLIREAAQRTLDTNQRHDTSMIVRELIDQARGASA